MNVNRNDKRDELNKIVQFLEKNWSRQSLWNWTCGKYSSFQSTSLDFASVLLIWGLKDAGRLLQRIIEALDEDCVVVEDYFEKLRQTLLAKRDDCTKVRGI